MRTSWYTRAFGGKRGLVAINAALLGTLGAITFAPHATGQPVASRARGQYTMVAGKTASGGSHAVYIIDSSNQEMVALRWDQGKQSLTGLGYRNFAGDGLASAPGR